MKSLEIIDKKYVVKNNLTLENYVITPRAIESCMVPGTFHIKSIVVTEDDITITYRVDSMVYEFKKSDIRSGNISILEEAFLPQVIRKQGGCKPCTNCGRCSW